MKPRYPNVLLAYCLLLFLCLACNSREAPVVGGQAMTSEELARMFEATLEKEAQALDDSLLPEKASLHFGYPPVKNILSQEDMQWLLYDEPLMLYIEVDDFRTEHAEFE